jgi:hypothetical protein
MLFCMICFSLGINYYIHSKYLRQSSHRYPWLVALLQRNRFHACFYTSIWRFELLPLTYRGEEPIVAST